MDEPIELTPQQTRAIELALEGWTYSEIGAELGVHRTTAMRWLREDPAVSKAYAEAQSEQLGNIVRRMRGKAGRVAEIALEIIEGRGAGSTALQRVRLQGAFKWLDRVGLAAGALVDPAKPASKAQVGKRAANVLRLIKSAADADESDGGASE